LPAHRPPPLAELLLQEFGKAFSGVGRAAVPAIHARQPHSVAGDSRAGMATGGTNWQVLYLHRARAPSCMHEQAKPPRRPTPGQRAEISALAALPDEKIDTKDIPEVLDSSGAQRGLFCRFRKKKISHISRAARAKRDKRPN